MKIKNKSDIYISLTVVACSIFLAFVLIFKIGKFQIGHATEVKIVFNFVNGLDSGAPVRFGGALVGKVDRVEVLNLSEQATLGKGKSILVVAKITKPVELTEGTEVTVNTMGFIGEKYIEIRPGPLGSPPLSGNLLVGDDPAQMEKLVSSGQKLVDELLVTAQKLNSVTAQLDARLPGLTDKMERTLDNADRAMKTIGSEQSQEQIRQTLANLKVITTYGKIFFGTVAEKPWRLFWGGKVNKLPPENQILERYEPQVSNQAVSTPAPIAAPTPAPELVVEKKGVSKGNPYSSKGR